MLIMLVIDILCVPGDLISDIDAVSIRPPKYLNCF